MFDKYLIDAASVRNIGPQDAPTGFAFNARLGYYRGLEVTMVENLVVTVDGQAVSRESVRFHRGADALTLDDLEQAFGTRWEFGAFATISVISPGGLATGEHKIGFKEVLRISYLPFPLVAEDSKTVMATAG